MFHGVRAKRAPLAHAWQHHCLHCILTNDADKSAYPNHCHWRPSYPIHIIYQNRTSITQCHNGCTWLVSHSKMLGCQYAGTVMLHCPTKAVIIIISPDWTQFKATGQFGDHSMWGAVINEVAI